MRILCLINPVAGGKKGSRCLRELQQLSGRGVFEGVVVESRPDALADQLAAAHDFDFVLLGGGDGTISMALQHLGDGAKAAILPLGTANDLAREIGASALRRLPLQQVLDVYANARPARFTLWRLCYGPHFGRQAIFSNYCSLGYDAEVVHRCHVLRRGVLYRIRACGPWATRMAYGAAGVAALAAPLLRGVSVAAIEFGSAARRSAQPALRSLLFTNISAIMGLGRANSTSSGFDTQLEWQPIRHVTQYPRMMLPVRPAMEPPSAGGWEISGVPPETPVQLDGEPRPDIRSESYRLLPAGSVTLLIPSAKASGA